MVYTWKAASQIKASAQMAGEVCEELERTIGLTPKTLLDASRADDAPLHDEFEWNDTIAAEAYRETQASYIIRMLCIKPEDSAQEPYRAYFPVQLHTYENTHVIMTDSNKRGTLLETALKELSSFKKKYGILSELAGVFAAIDAAEQNAK